MCIQIISPPPHPRSVQEIPHLFFTVRFVFILPFQVYEGPLLAFYYMTYRNYNFIVKVYSFIIVQDCIFN